ncbi:MFS transporter-like protein [Microthyrium microscopicum]|uniref:MFS transporter-like protein n=1 Tax=Microthyrium microscopicum TaxID=703497 RepID=A0A6A6U1B5_9PEZI|nr:MFS transporter-like protein [Microthyrium microscopicum]
MPLGIWEDKYMAMPPGTVELDAKFSSELPQPSDDPNDPLNWSELWKNSVLMILSISVAVVIALGPMVTPGLPTVAKQYGVSMDEVSEDLLGAMQFAAGGALVFVAAFATIYGKRAFFVTSVFLLIGTCVWGFFAKSLKSLLVMRIIQGMSTAPIEALVTPTVADLFFVHQRGSRLALWHMMVSAGAGLGHVLSGFIIQYLGFHWTFGMSAICFGVIAPFFIFVVSETTYIRPKSAYEKNYQVEKIEYTETTEEVPPPKRSYVQSLSLYNGKFSNEPFLKLLVKPAPLLLFPAVIFSTVVNGFHLAGLIAMGLLSVTILKDEPYNLQPAALGMVSIPNLVVGLIFAPIAGYLCDWLAQFLARRNNGIFEPEYRLLLMIIAVPISTVSFIGYGLAVERKASIAWILFYSSLQAVATPFASQAALTYVLDCHPRDSNPAFVAINFFKTIFIFVITSKASGWLEHFGPRNLFNALAAINLVVSCFTVPGYVFGKRFRSYLARSKLAQKIATE